ncbi:hypothetical protein GCK32_011050 [Trichostrongylus colubriformis]|uniref:PUM-HD domain-containing protein n=1 Tax=Trichostrongylus colubriformis TaxID=6319 RepID=A0AAN8FKU5_TRICO
MDLTSQLPVAYPSLAYDSNGFGCRSTFLSPIYCQDTSQLSDSGICISSSSKVDVLSEDVTCSPPGFPATPIKPELSDQRRPLGCLNGNVQFGENAPPSFTPFRFQQDFDRQSPLSSYIVSPLSKLRLNQTCELDTSLGDNRTRSALPSWVMDGHGHIIAPLKKLLEEGLLETFARDKSGCTSVDGVWHTPALSHQMRKFSLLSVSVSFQKTNKRRAPMLDDLMAHLVANCERLACNEFANYVIQHVIKAGPLSDYRDRLIEECLLRNLLSLSQEKYASHVVEKALEFAPPALLAEMMDEIFDGYVPHPETKKDALDIMLFHQYGNYVVQRMLDICCEAARAKRNGINLPDMELRMEWLNRLEARITQNRNRLARYSSGKKILSTLQQLNDCPIIIPNPIRSRHSCTPIAVPSKYR